MEEYEVKLVDWKYMIGLCEEIERWNGNREMLRYNYIPRPTGSGCIIFKILEVYFSKIIPHTFNPKINDL